MVRTHIDKFGSLLDTAEGRIHHRLRRTGKGHDRAIGRLSGVHVQQSDALDLLDALDYLLYNFRAASFAKIGDALNDTFHVRVWHLCVYLCLVSI